MSKTTPKPHKQFLMRFFGNEEKYEEREVNGFWLIKHFDGNLKVWTVSLFPADSYANYKRANQLNEEEQARLDFIKHI